MRHRAASDFWTLYHALPKKIRSLSDKNFVLMTKNPRHPSLHFKKVDDDLWSARIGSNYRALALEDDKGYTWIWIGTHAEYDHLLK